MAKRRRRLRVFRPDDPERTTLRVSKQTADALAHFGFQLLLLATLDDNVKAEIEDKKLTNDVLVMTAAKLASSLMEQSIERKGKEKAQ